MENSPISSELSSNPLIKDPPSFELFSVLASSDFFSGALKVGALKVSDFPSKELLEVSFV